MTLLIIGVLLWSLTHLLTTLFRPQRQKLIDALGEKPYMGVFALAIVLSIVLIVFGWRSTPERFVYILGPWSRHATMLLMLVSFILLGLANAPSRIKQYIRHPQLTGVIVWTIAHLLSNGTGRALVLFGGILIWAILEIVLINRRDPQWEPPPARPIAREFIGVAISVVLMVVVMFLHPYFTGVSLTGR